MAEKLLKATHGSDKTPLKLGNLEIPCYVLEDGTRVFSGRGIQRVLGSDSKSGTWIQSFVKKPAISSRIFAGEMSVIDRINSPIKFKRPDAGGSQSTTYGYEVTLLIDICSAIIDANRAGEFDDEIIVRNADIIIRAVAKVGIIALVDEVTGYQYEREKDTLQVILAAFISKELLKWQKMFPDTFYYEIFRLKRWDYTVSGIRKRPSVIGTWTKKLIYEQLPQGVLEELQSKTPKSPAGNYTARFFQSLTPDIGHPALTAQIYKVIGLMNAASNWDEFNALFNRMVDKNNGNQELDFDAIETDIAKSSAPDAKDLSLFDQSLKTALDFNPKDSE